MRVSPIILAILCCAIIVSCKKNHTSSDTLPPITQTGANTFGCKINGVVWVPYFECSSFTGSCSEMKTNFLYPSANLLPLSFQVGVERSNKVNNEGSFYIANLNFGQLSSTTISGTGNVFDSLYVSCVYNNIAYDNYGFPGQAQITGDNFTITKLDTANKIMSGVFNFTLHTTNDSLVITDGRFDFKIEDYCRCSQ